MKELLPHLHQLHGIVPLVGHFQMKPLQEQNNFSQEISFSEKTAFIVHDKNVLNFNENSLRVYFQNGYLLKNLKLEKLNLPTTFTTAKNGGIKTSV